MMKLSTLLVTALIAAVIVILPANSRAQTSTPQQTVRSFYKWYVHEVNADRYPLKNKVTLQKYVTGRLIARIRKAQASEDGLDADYFLSAQDFDKDWERNITVSNLVVKGDTTTLSVLLDGKLIPKHRLKVVLKKEGGSWKIDRVNDWNI